jgi:hypothetical protein
VSHNAQRTRPYVVYIGMLSLGASCKLQEYAGVYNQQALDQTLDLDLGKMLITNRRRFVLCLLYAVRAYIQMRSAWRDAQAPCTAQISWLAVQCSRWCACGTGAVCGFSSVSSRATCGLYRYQEARNSALGLFHLLAVLSGRCE